MYPVCFVRTLTYYLLSYMHTGYIQFNINGIIIIVPGVFLFCSFLFTPGAIYNDIMVLVLDGFQVRTWYPFGFRRLPSGTRTKEGL